ncbi:MAG: hypothetical protein ACLFR2_11905 [Candidatus Kapaibacterium sp.]
MITQGIEIKNSFYELNNRGEAELKRRLDIEKQKVNKFKVAMAALEKSMPEFSATQVKLDKAREEYFRLLSILNKVRGRIKKEKARESIDEQIEDDLRLKQSLEAEMKRARRKGLEIRPYNYNDHINGAYHTSAMYDLKARILDVSVF